MNTLILITFFIYTYLTLSSFPYKSYFSIFLAQAVVVGHQHFVTFDKVFYDFAGECSYLLTRDFEDGNFTLALKPKEGDQPASIVVLKGETTIELTSGQTSVSMNT